MSQKVLSRAWPAEKNVTKASSGLSVTFSAHRHSAEWAVRIMLSVKDCEKTDAADGSGVIRRQQSCCKIAKAEREPASCCCSSLGSRIPRPRNCEILKTISASQRTYAKLGS